MSSSSVSSALSFSSSSSAPAAKYFKDDFTGFGGNPQRWKDPNVPANQKMWSFGGVNNMAYDDSDRFAQPRTWHL